MGNSRGAARAKASSPTRARPRYKSKRTAGGSRPASTSPQKSSRVERDRHRARRRGRARGCTRTARRASPRPTQAHESNEQEGTSSGRRTTKQDEKQQQLHLPPLTKHFKSPHRGRPCPRASPRSKGGDGNTSSRAMAEDLRGKEDLPAQITPSATRSRQPGRHNRVEATCSGQLRLGALSPVVPKR